MRPMRSLFMQEGYRRVVVDTDLHAGKITDDDSTQTSTTKKDNYLPENYAVVTSGIYIEDQAHTPTISQYHSGTYEMGKIKRANRKEKERKVKDKRELKVKR